MTGVYMMPYLVVNAPTMNGQSPAETIPHETTKADSWTCRAEGILAYMSHSSDGTIGPVLNCQHIIGAVRCSLTYTDTQQGYASRDGDEVL